MSDILKTLTCPICYDPLLKSVLTSDGIPIHEFCANQYFSTTQCPKSLTTNEPLKNTNLIHNTFINNEFKNFIEQNTDFDNYLLSLSIPQINQFQLHDLIKNTKRLHLLIEKDKLNQIQQITHFYDAEMIKTFNEQIFKMIKNKKEDEIIKLLKQNIIDIHKTNGDDNTLLIHACKHNLQNLSIFLIQLESIDINHINDHNETALIWAAYNSEPNICLALLNRGAEINHADNANGTALIWACMRTLPDIANILLNDPTIEINVITNNAKSTALILACKNGMYDTVHKLLTFPNININHQNRCGETALHTACINKHTHIALLLLTFPTIQMHQTDNSDQSPLNYACANNLIDVVTKLIKYPGFYSESVLIWACKNSHINIVLKLLTIKDLKYNSNAFILALTNNLFPIVHQFLTIFPTNIDINQRFLNQTIILWACKNSHTDIASILLTYNNLDVDHIDDAAETALSWACKNNLHEIAIQLITRSTTSNTPNKLNAIKYAFANNSPLIVSKILDTTIIHPNPLLNLYQSLSNETHKQALLQLTNDALWLVESISPQHNTDITHATHHIYIEDVD